MRPPGLALGLGRGGGVSLGALALLSRGRGLGSLGAATRPRSKDLVGAVPGEALALLPEDRGDGGGALAAVAELGFVAARVAELEGEAPGR